MRTMRKYLPTKIRSKIYKTYMYFGFIVNNFAALLAKGRDSYSDFGEDQIIEKVLGKDKGSYLDIGAGHPIIGRNTYLFYKKGWTGITVEPIRFHNILHRIKRRHDTQIRKLIGNSEKKIKFYEFSPTQYSTVSEDQYSIMIKSGAKERKVYYLETISVTEILSQFKNPNYFLSIDCEGYDFQIISDINWNYIIKPKAIVFETIVDSIMSSAVHRILINQGYSLIQKTVNNSIYQLT